MNDIEIIDLYFSRSEDAISETAKKYGRYCHRIAFNILCNLEDSEECVNDTYMRTWNAIPPERPNIFSVFLGRITRNLALDKYKYYHAKKRGNNFTSVAFEELKDCIPATSSTEQAVDNIALAEMLNRFLADLPAVNRKIFIQRYWYFSSIKDIASEHGMSESKVKMMMSRTRLQLKEFLEKEGVCL